MENWQNRQFTKKGHYGHQCKFRNKLLSIKPICYICIQNLRQFQLINLFNSRTVFERNERESEEGRRRKRKNTSIWKGPEIIICKTKDLATTTSRVSIVIVPDELDNVLSAQYRKLNRFTLKGYNILLAQ